MPSNLETVLAQRIKRAENPEWYLHLLGISMEEFKGKLSKAIRATDEMVKKTPHPPASAEDRAWKMIGDHAALDDYLAGPKKDEGEEVVESLEPAERIVLDVPHVQGTIRGT